MINAIIPTYNSALYILQAVESVMFQNHGDFEIIIVDDGSTDGTATIVRKKFPEVLLITQPNKGPAAARNRGIESAHGDLIAFLDADDIWTQNKTGDQLEVFRRFPDVAMVCSDMAETDSNGKIVISSMLHNHGLLERFKELDGSPIPKAFSKLLEKNFIPTGTVIVKKNVLQEVGFFREDFRFGEDMELWARVAAKYPIVCLPKVHLLRRRHHENITSDSNLALTEQLRIIRCIHEWGRDYLKDEGVNSGCFVARSLWHLGYHSFFNEDFKAARQYFCDAFSFDHRFKYILYIMASMLPGKLVRFLRETKNKIL